jgi:RimJ/RimL family protein N-acetyltransferase
MTLAFTEAWGRFPRLAELADEMRDEIVGNSRAAVLIDRITRRVRAMAGERAALFHLVRELPSMGCREVTLLEDASSAEHHAALVAAHYAPSASRTKVSRSLVFAPRPHRAWTHRRESEVGHEAFAALVYAAMQSPADATRHLDAYARCAALTPPRFRDHAWTALELDGQLVGVALPAPSGPRGIAVAFLGLVPSMRSKGLAADALRSVLARAALSGSHIARAEIDSENLAAQRAFMRVGFTNVGRIRSYVLTRF